MKVSELIEMLKDLDRDLQVCKMGMPGHGMPAFPEEFSKVIVEKCLFYSEEEKDCVLLKTMYE